MTGVDRLDCQPDVHPTAWVAPGATVLGDAHLGPEASVWYSAVVRADLETIALGARTNVQDGAVLHADPGVPLVLGEDVTVGHGAMLHGCTVGDRSLVGIGAIVLNGARVGSGCVVAAGSLVPPGASVPDGSLVMGSPATVVRETTGAEREGAATNARHYVALMRRHRAATPAG
ncbi:MAG TPA: gamma carbonic anhydrase family protein [Dermatophilaceae bacterium]|nr:gamma carbonic anhydrase family protein [Dermatophilaceae bacterium]